MGLPSDTALISPPTADVAEAWTPPVLARSQSNGTSWMAWTLSAVLSVWIAVVLISVFAPDMISGSEQQRMPVAAFGTWLWGFGASIATFVAMARLLGDVSRRPLWIVLSSTTIAIWVAASLVSIFGPTTVTGSDPTTIPMTALISPVVAMLATIGVGTVVLVANGLGGPPHEVR